ncbi:membrane protein [Tsuneonella deserti]|uniref:Membrane protein n=1 Tax=Tsuneonella deserti TaxID=2035528 RepID=A0ABQ1S0W5_9SPHN|nr:HupE/UreJ family protein [Tsuneonella deserti]GGD86570.1 membrane protein [Tsuneonella deserti]
MRLLAALLFLLLAAPASADELRPGFVELRQRNAAEWTLEWKQPLTTPGEPRLVVPLFPGNCRIASGPHRRVAALALVGSADLICRGPLAGGRAGYAEILGGGDVVLRVVPLNARVQSYRLTPQEPAVELASKPSAWQVWRTYGVLGFTHILGGWDHLLFVIALVLLVRRGWAVARAVTAFTVAHSLTLAGVTLGLVGLPQAPVEALIALSIVFLAAELTRDGKGLTLRYPWAIAFAFGLVHGFGFAGALREIGLPDGEVPAALLAFNLGVEAGQIGVVLVVLGLLALLERARRPAVAPAVRMAAYGIGITASYWLVDRLFA